MTWYVYLLRCQDDSLYTGITTDLRERVKSHTEGRGSSYVASRGVNHLLYAIQAEDRSHASKIEHGVKQLRREEKQAFFAEHSALAYQPLR